MDAGSDICSSVPFCSVLLLVPLPLLAADRRADVRENLVTVLGFNHRHSSSKENILKLEEKLSGSIRKSLLCI